MYTGGGQAGWQAGRQAGRYILCTYADFPFILQRLLMTIYGEGRAQRLINLEILVLERSLKSGNIELGQYLDGRQLF